MPLTGGTRIGPYEVGSLLGVGGMGEVYRARDTRLKRDVALKILPESFASDPARLARFQREAEVLAALNHPHIGGIYGLEDAGDVHALVLELVEGDTLADRIARGPIPIDEAVPIARQIAEALQAAHERGIIHRDLKPANIKLRPDGTVKVLDFGLAKTIEGERALPGAIDLTHSPTLSVLGTEAGLILGTAAYMSPEQAKGAPADSRSDIFSFGAVLYEMLVRVAPFQGDSAPEILAAVLTRDPDWSRLPSDLHPQLVHLLQRSLAKSPGQRWQTVADLRAELEWIASHPRGNIAAAGGAPAPRRSRIAAVIVLTALAAGALSAAVALSLSRDQAPRTVERFSWLLPEGEAVNISQRTIAVSPDGTRLAFDGLTGLYVRATSESDARLIVEGDTTEPTFSPDGEWIVFEANSSLRKVAFSGGPVATLGSAPGASSISWGRDGILFAAGRDGIFRISPNGGMAEQLVTLRANQWVYGPQMLPGGRLLFTLSTGDTAADWDAAQIVTQDLASGERTTVLKGGRDARYLASGHLVVAQGGALVAAPFDPRRGQLTRNAVPIVDGVRRSTSTGASHFSVSDTGLFAYIPGPKGIIGGQVDIVIADRNAVAKRLPIPTGLYEFPRLSPDAKRLAFGTGGTEPDIWLYDLGGTTAPRRLTFGGRNRFPVWSPDGQRIAFQSDREGDLGIYWQRADGGETAERLTRAAGTAHVPQTWSPRQDRLLFDVVGDDVTLTSLSMADRKVEPFGGVHHRAQPTSASFSPDGRWVTYRSTSGTIEVQPVPPTGATYQISNGFHPQWSRDGKEIFFITGGFGRMSVARVTTEPRFAFTVPIIFQRGFNEKLGPSLGKNYDVTPDGKFIGLAAPGQNAATAAQIYVVVNWFEELKRLAPAN